MIQPVVKKRIYPQQDLANRLRAALEDSGLTQAELARACGVTDQAVYKWLTTGTISKHHLPTISVITGKGLEYFLIGLKMSRRVAAIAPLFVIAPLVAQGINALRQMACVLCQIVWLDFKIVKQPLSLSRTAT